MNAHTIYVIVAVIVLALAAFAFWRRWGIKRFPLSIYVITVAVVWVVLLAVMWLLGDTARFQTFALVGLGFALGMIAMYVAVYVYKS